MDVPNLQVPTLVGVGANGMLVNVKPHLGTMSRLAASSANLPSYFS